MQRWGWGPRGHGPSQTHDHQKKSCETFATPCFDVGNAGLDLDVLQRRSKHPDGPEKAPKYAFRDPKIKHFLGRGHQTYSPMGTGTPSPYLTPHIIGVCGAFILAPLALESTTWPPNPNPGSAPGLQLSSVLYNARVWCQK